MYFTSIIVIYLDNGAENSCISSNFVMVMFFLQCLIRWIDVGCMEDYFPVNKLMVSKSLWTSFKENLVRMSKYCAHVVDALMKNTLVRLL
jgi:hypothetical protein